MEGNDERAASMKIIPFQDWFSKGETTYREILIIGHHPLRRCLFYLHYLNSSFYLTRWSTSFSRLSRSFLTSAFSTSSYFTCGFSSSKSEKYSLFPSSKPLKGLHLPFSKGGAYSRGGLYIKLTTKFEHTLLWRGCSSDEAFLDWLRSPKWRAKAL